MKYTDEELASAINNLTRNDPASADGGKRPPGPSDARGDSDRDTALMAQAVFNQGLEVVLNQTPPKDSFTESFALRLRNWLQWALSVIIEGWVDAGMPTPELKHRRSIFQSEWAKRCL